MADVARQAWQALRRSRRLLPHPLERASVQMPLMLGGTKIKGGQGRKERVYTGMSIARARETLVASGLSAAEADRALQAAVLQHFRAFAGSWGNYVTRNGWLYELLELPEAERQPIIERCHIGELAQLIKRLVDNPASIMLDIASLAELTQLANRIQQDKEQPDSPIRYLLTEQHGLHPELALAVLKYSQAVPWWALIALPLAALVLILVFWQALVNPHAEFFENAGGVGLAHYLLVPLMAAAFIIVSIWLVRDRPRREREWREQLAEYRQAVESEHAG
jgi:hypothetical protein